MIGMVSDFIWQKTGKLKFSLHSIYACLTAFRFIPVFMSWLCFVVFQKKNNYNHGGKRRMNMRTSMAQREEVIRRTVYVSDIDQQVKRSISYFPCSSQMFFWEFIMWIDPFSP